MPGDTVIHHRYSLDVIERGRLRQFRISHAGINPADLDTFEQHHEVDFLFPRIVDAIPLDFGGLQRLAFLLQPYRDKALQHQTPFRTRPASEFARQLSCRSPHQPADSRRVQN